MIKNREIKIRGCEYNGETKKFQIKELNCICTNDSKGKTLSIDNGVIQFSIPIDEICKIFN